MASRPPQDEPRVTFTHPTIHVLLLKLLVHLSILSLNPFSVDALTGKVLIVSFDGFRWDYLNFIPGLTYFKEVAENGASAEYMNNTFTTLTFATHHSMATGLYQESHGIVSNYMYDPIFGQDFWPGCCNGQKWWGGEPIWITAKKQGKIVGGYFWPGTEVVYDGIKPDFVEKYDISIPFTDRVDTVLDWFEHEDLDLGLVYFQQPDKAGHKYGPRSDQVKEQVLIVDSVLGYLMDGVKSRELDSILNVIIVSDHGVANMTFDKIVDVSKYVNMSLIEKFVENGAICHVFPKEGAMEEVYTLLHGQHPHMTVYKREDIPEHWHYTNNRRIGPIFLAMDEHWTCTEDINLPWHSDKGAHGYDNKVMSMKPIFMAIGPDIKQGYRVKPFMSLDIYPLTAKLLDIDEAPNNGTLKIVNNIIRDSEPKSDAVISHGSSAALEGSVSFKMLSLLMVSIWFKSLLTSS